MRMAALAEQKVIEFAPLRDNPGRSGELFKEFFNDFENCKHYARMIKEGFVFVHRDNISQVERKPVDESKIPPKYR
jgi:hypothetical protein